MRSELPRPSRLVGRGLSVVLVAVGLALLIEHRPAQLVESWVQGHLLRLVGTHAQILQTAVLFTINGKLTGISLTSGCTIGPVLGVFYLAAGIVSWFRPLPLVRVLVGAAQLVTMFLVANQVRIAVIVASMKRWGFQRGYDFSHVFLGSAITTLGFIFALAVFVRLVVRKPEVTADV